MATTVAAITPRLPPPPEGVGTYALSLARELECHHGFTTHFLVPTDHAAHAEPGLAVTALEPDAGALVAALEATGSSTALVHYANYGYAARGCPTWLVDGLKTWQRGSSEPKSARRIVTMFHELWATGPPWTSSFWFSPVQRKLAGRLARASHATVTSLDLYAELLSHFLGERRARVMPVFSTVGELESPVPLDRREPKLVIFGGRGARQRAYGELAPVVEECCRRLGLDEVLDIGPPLSSPPRLPRLGVKALGLLSAEEVSAQLAHCRAAFVAYPTSFLSKSTIFAAYAAHGVFPVCVWNVDEPEAAVVLAPLTPGRQFWSPSANAPNDEATLQQIATTAHAWYREHRLERQAELFAGLLTSQIP